MTTASVTNANVASFEKASITTTANLSPHRGDLLLMVGTVKGAFLFLSDRKRGDFKMTGPHFPGQQVWSAAFIGDGAPRIIVGNKSEHWGAMVSRSDDFGATWTEPTDGNIKFPKGSSLSLNAIWALEASTPLGPDVVLAGVDPAALYRSDDRGETFQINEAMFSHPDREKWNPGFGGLCLHSILVHPQNPKRIYAAISSGGIYSSDDGGDSWNTCTNGLRVNPDVPGATLCPHKLRFDPEDPSRLYLQNHPGVYRTDNEGRSWVTIEGGLPSDFGFPMVTHPRRGGTIYTFPLKADAFRVPPEGAPRVWRSRDAGESWEPLGKGLPAANGFFTVLRDAFSADTLDPAGLYFGTRGGQLYGSNDEGESWRAIAEFLPPVLCVKTAIVQ
jgi:photosystem II stability/assembly factor-like uncharacterized protein